MFADLETERLFLRGISSADRDFILREFSNEDVNRYLFDAEPMTSLADADELIAFYTQPEPRNRHRWVIVDKRSGRRLGTCGFHCWDGASASCELGYELLPGGWGQGYAYEAVTAILRFAADRMGARRVRAIIAEGNEASERLAARLGFRYRGQNAAYTFHGATYPHRVYELALGGAQGERAAPCRAE